VVVVALLVVVVPVGVVGAPAATQTSYPGKRWSQVDVPTAGFQLRKLASVMPFAPVMRSHVSNLCHHIYQLLTFSTVLSQMASLTSTPASN